MTDAARGAEELAGILRRGGKLKHDLLVGADLRQADLSGARLDQLDLSGARLDGATLAGSSWHGCRLDKTCLNDAVLSNAHVSDCRGTGPTLRSEARSGGDGCGSTF